MQLLRSIDRNVQVFKRNASIRGSRLRIMRWHGEGHLILLKVEERSKSDVSQDEDGQKYPDEGAQRVFLFLDAVLLYATRLKGNSPEQVGRQIVLQST
jgi:hypothetical protein